MILTERFQRAFELAFSLHAGQTRKGTDIPYISHLISVAALVMENGGEEDQVIAGLLHDAVEDSGGLATLNLIRDQFGERVAEIVDGCTDTYLLPKPPWRTRKEEYLAHLTSSPPETRLVSLADKLHNARSLLSDVRHSGPAVWDRFNGGKTGSLWYYRALSDFFTKNDPSPMADELERVVSELERLAR
ncbi:MAG: HD domain-containing protein [Anaerolineales bacterium]|jgi:(p)ppGpp synthase/HD superfamily hydrolase|nr:HD domain-containing protein [Anaerolineales bacterium]